MHTPSWKSMFSQASEVTEEQCDPNAHTENTHTNKTNPPKKSKPPAVFQKCLPLLNITGFNELVTTKFSNHLTLKVHFLSSSCIYLYTNTYHSIFKTTLIRQWQLYEDLGWAEVSQWGDSEARLKCKERQKNKNHPLFIFSDQHNRGWKCSVFLFALSKSGFWSHILLQCHWLCIESMVSTGGSAAAVLIKCVCWLCVRKQGGQLTVCSESVHTHL